MLLLPVSSSLPLTSLLPHRESLFLYQHILLGLSTNKNKLLADTACGSLQQQNKILNNMKNRISDG